MVPVLSRVNSNVYLRLPVCLYVVVINVMNNMYIDESVDINIPVRRIFMNILTKRVMLN